MANQPNVQASYPPSWQLRSFCIVNAPYDRGDAALFRAAADWLERDPTHRITIRAITWSDREDRDVELLIHYTD